MMFTFLKFHEDACTCLKRLSLVYEMLSLGSDAIA